MLPDMDKKPEKPLIVKMAGYLEKKGRMRVVGVRRWKKRWCVLEGKLLLYFRTQLEYSHQLSPCRGSVNMGLVLSITPRGPCQLQIVTRSQIIIFRTKTKCEQEEWFTALRDARNNNNNNHTFVKPMDQKTFVAEMRRRLADECTKSNNYSIVNENHLRYGRSLKVSLDDIFFELSRKNGLHLQVTTASRRNLRKSESDNRISFYRERHGLVRTETATAVSPADVVADKESCCRSRSLSYESIYFKPQEKCAPSIESSKSQSCRELVPKVTRRASKKSGGCGGSVSKRMSRSESFFQSSCADSDSDDYDYIEVPATGAGSVKPKYSKPMTQIEESEQYPELPPRVPEKCEEISSLSTVAQSEEFPNQEANIDVIYVENDRKLRVSESEPESDLALERGSEKTVEVEEEPPPLPIKKKPKQDIFVDEERQYQVTNGVYVFNNGAEEVIYDVPIPHGKLIEHFRRLTITPVPPVKRYTDNAVYDDSLEPSLFETIHMTPDSLEIASMFPTYKRWSNDSGFNYEEPNSFSPDQTHFEDSLEPVIAMMHHDRKIWQNVPNINSTDYFR